MNGEEQQLNPTQRKLLDEVYARLDVWEQGDRFYHERAKTIREVIRCNDPGQDPPPREGQRTPDKPTLQLQTLKATYNNAVAEQMLNLPDAKLTSETAEQAECVEDLQDILHHVIYNTNDYETVHRRLAEDFLGPGTAIVQVAWDDDMANGKGDVKILRWPMEAFLWDPQCEDIQDSRAVMKVGWHPLSWFAEHYPEQADYICGEEGQHNNVGVPTAQYDKTAGDEDRAMLVEYWYRKYDAKKHRYTINVCVCAGGALLDEQEDVYDHGMYPFVVCAHSTIEGCFAGDGMVEELVPMMRYINRYAAYIDENLRMSSKGRLLVREDSGIDREALADWSQDMIEGKGVVKGQDWDWLSHEPMNGMAVSMMQIFQGDLKADSGYNSATRGEAVGGVGYTSGKAYLAMQQAGGKIASMRGQVLQGMFRRMAEQVLWLISQFYDDKRIVIVTGRDNANRQVTMDARKYFGFDKKKAIAPPPYTVRVETTSKDPTQVGAMNDMYMQAYTMAAQAQQNFPLSALFRIMNIEGKDRLLPIIEANESQQAQMQQMAEQLQQQERQMEQMQKENASLKDTAARLNSALASVGALPQQEQAPVNDPNMQPMTSAMQMNQAYGR